jgi:hypothetical protein
MRIFLVALYIFSILLVAGCGSGGSSGGFFTSSGGGGGGDPTTTSGIQGTTHFFVLDQEDREAMSLERVGGRFTGGHGLFAVSSVLAEDGRNAWVKFTVYLGPWGTQNNAPGPGQQPFLWPDYADGAQVNRGPEDYEPIPLTQRDIAGSGGYLWGGIVTTFPTNGRFTFTLTRNGNIFRDPSNVFVEGQEKDSSFDPSRQQLQAHFDPVTGQIIIP